MNHVDLARFEFDYDTTWTSFFLDADLNVYSRYGGRGLGGVLGTILIVLLVLWLVGALGGGRIMG